MTDGSSIAVNSHLSIPRHELKFRASRAGGPGGQHVNTSSTRVELVWNVRRSRSVTSEQRSRLEEKLDKRIDADGNVRIVASAFRSQARNRDDAEERLGALLRRALTVAKARKPTRPHRAAVENRLRSKKKESERKRERSARDFD